MTEGPLRAAAPDFDHPIEMLAACHERIEERCELLHRLVAHMAEHGGDEQARQAAANVLRYFDTAGEHHHRDEEDDLFPKLLAANARGAAKLVRRLQTDHVQMRSQWRRLREPLQMLAEGTAVQLDVELIERFTLLYRSHITVEEADLFPLALSVLGEQAIEQIGASMARRRGVKQ